MASRILNLRRYSIRSLLVLTLIVAVFFAFPYRRAANQQRGREWVLAQRGHVYFKHDFNYKTKQYSIPNVPSFLVAYFGVDLFNPVRGVVFDCDELTELDPIKDLQTVRSIYVNIEMVDDIDFGPLSELPELREIQFSKWSLLTESQLAKLRELLPNIKVISETHGTADGTE